MYMYQSLVLYTCMCVYMYCTADLGIKQTFTYTTLYVCLYDRVALPKGTNQKSLDEISLNPIAPRDRQSTLRFENSISAVWRVL